MSNGKDLSPVLKQVAAALKEAQTALVEQQPKVEAFDALMAADGNCLLRDACKIINFPGTQQEFYQWLVDKQDIYRKTNWALKPYKVEMHPNSTPQQKGYYVLKAGHVPCGDRNVTTNTTRVTPKGVEHLRRILKKDFELEENEE